MSKQKQTKARCLFCRAEGVSKEHIFAKSLTDLFPGHGVVRHAYEPPEGGTARPVKRAKTFAYISRKFCRACNSGWLREADDAVRDVLAAFATNQPVALAPPEQERLALWATKIALGFLSIEPKDYRFATPEQYHELYRERAPLAGSQVWLGANNHGDMAWVGAHSLVFYLMYHGRLNESLRLRMGPHRAFKQIWPTQDSVAWPPPSRIRPNDLSPLANIINANSNFVPRA